MHRTIALSQVAAAALLLAACSQALPVELPDLTQKAPDGLSAAEQRRAIEALDQRKASHASDAAAEIAREKRR